MSHDFTPRYYEIEQALRETIANSQPGDALPSESALCARFAVSRMTARHAMQGLVRDGLVYRIAGHGSFVANAAVHRQANKLLSFSDEMRLAGKEPSSELRRFERRSPTGEERASLRLAGRVEVVAIHRVRLADAVPITHERAVLSPRCQELEEDEVGSASLHALLRRLGCQPSRGRATLAAEPATEEDADLLRIDRGSSVLVERRLILDPRDQPLEYTISRYAADRYMLDVGFDVEAPTAEPT